MPPLMWSVLPNTPSSDASIDAMVVRVYFLQILDKSCVGYGATFGLQTEAVRSTSLDGPTCS